MKKTKLLSIVLSVCMILSIVQIPAFAAEEQEEIINEADAVLAEADAEEAVPEEAEPQEEEAVLDGDGEYYVLNGGTGNGKTPETPAASVSAVIATIKADGRDVAGETVIVNVMQYDDWKTKFEALSVKDNSKLPNSFLTSLTGPNGSYVAAHSATLHVRSYDPQEDGVVNYLLYNDNVGSGNTISTLGGPMIFENVMIVRNRYCDRMLVFGGYSMTFLEGVTFGAMKASQYGDQGSANWDETIYPAGEGGGYEGAYLYINNSGSTIADDVNIVLENAFNAIGANASKKTGLFIGDQGTFQKDVNVVINNENIKTKINLAANTDKYATINGNLNINIKAADTIIWDSQNAGGLDIDGALTVIASEGVKFQTGTGSFSSASISAIPSKVNVDGGKWFITLGAGCDFETTATAGTYNVTVPAGNVAYAVSEDEATVYYGDGNMTLPEGAWAVSTTSDIEAVLATLSPTTDVPLMEFDKWEDKGGKYVATFKSRGAATYEYYVVNGGTGDGKTAAAPIGSIADAVSAANKAGASEGDLIMVYIMDKSVVEGSQVTITGSRSTPTQFTYWTRPATHKATLVVKGYDGTNSHLAYSRVYGGTDMVNISGPTVFDDITLVRMRAYDSAINACGYPLTIGSGCVFKTIDKDDPSGTYTVVLQDYNYIVFLMRAYMGDPVGSGAYITIAKDNGRQFDIRMGGNDTKTYDNFTLDIPSATGGINFSTDNAGASVSGNFNIILGNVPSVSFTATKTVNSVKVPVPPLNVGALQLIKKPETTGDFTTWFVSDNDYIINTDNPEYLLVTDTAGVYEIVGGKVAYSYDEDLQEITYYEDTITVAPGEYTFMFADSLEALKENCKPAPADGQYRFDHWETAGENKLKPVFVLRDDIRTGEYYVKLGGTGDGKSDANPAGDLASTVNAAVAEGYGLGDVIKVYIMDPENYLSTANGKVLNMTSWTRPNNHEATLVITGYNGTDSHLATYTTVGSNTGITLSGPTRFENITIVRARVSDNGIETLNYDCTLADSVKMYMTNQDQTWDGKIVVSGSNVLKIGQQQATNYSVNKKDGTLTVEFDNGKVMDIRSGYRETSTFPGDMNVVIKKASAGVKYSVSADAAKNSTYEKNFNFKLGDTPKFTWAVETGKAFTVTVEGALQFIKAPDTVIDNSANYAQRLTVEGGYYEISTEDFDKIDFTKAAGQYKIADGYYAAAANTETFETVMSEDGILTLTPGKWYVTFGTTPVKVTFDGENETTYIAGTKVFFPEAEGSIVFDFFGWTDGVTTFKTKELATVPAANTALTSVMDVPADTAIAYIDSANGSDSNNGQSADKAVKTIAQAFSIVTASSATTKKVIVVGNLDMPGGFPKHTSMVTLTGDGTGNSCISLNNDCIAMEGPMTFENIHLRSTTSAGGKVAFTGGNLVIFGEGVVNGKFAGAGVEMPWRFGNYATNAAGKETEIINGGNFSNIEVGAFWCGSRRYTTAGADITINGGTVSKMTFTSNGWDSTNQKGNDFTAPVFVTVNGGTLGAVAITTTQPYYAHFNDNVAFIFNNGTSCATDIYTTLAPSCDKNVYVVKVAENEFGGYLTAGDAGNKFNVNLAPGYEGYTAVAKAEGGATYVSKDGVLTITEGGTYDVTFTELILYTNDGTTIHSFADNVPVNLAEETPAAKDGKIFIGWAKVEGDVVTGTGTSSVTLNEGDELVAQYADYDEFDKYEAQKDPEEEGDFYILGTQIRLANPDKDVSQGLRFITQLKGSLKNALPNITEFGSAILPSDIVLGRDMLLEEKIITCSDGASSLTRYLYTKDDLPTLVPAAKIYKDLSDGGVQYTVCITNIDETKYDRFYTVRGYIKWTDYNGVEKVLLTDYYECNLYKVAMVALNDTNASYSEEITDNLEAIKDYVENTQRLAYFRENYDSRASIDENGNLVLVDAAQADKVKLLSGYAGVEWKFHGGSGDSKAKPATTSGQEDDRYKVFALKNGDGVRVREVTIDSGVAASTDPVTIVQYADTHFNYLNTRDFEEKNPALMSTAIYRTWNASQKGSASCVNGLNAVKFGNFFDKTVVTGDMIDYLSWGSADMTKAILFDRVYRGTFTLGNHEPTRNMQGKVSDPYSSNVMDVLQHIWTTNIYYHSEILKDVNGVEKVMLVSMQNSSYCYYDSQVEPLKADIALCREKGIPMLIFEHVPLSTNGNPDADTSTSVYCATAYGDSASCPINFSTGSSYGNFNASKGGATAEVYNTIVNSADVIKGIFCGDAHSWFYTEIYAKYGDGTETVGGKHVVIPQYTVTANAYNAGNVTLITVK